MHYYSKTTTGFYDESGHPPIPEDAVAVSDADYLTLFSVPKGVCKKIVPDANGYPVLVDDN
jgi:hypothetical protein